MKFWDLQACGVRAMCINTHVCSTHHFMGFKFASMDKKQSLYILAVVYHLSAVKSEQVSRLQIGGPLLESVQCCIWDCACIYRYIKAWLNLFLTTMCVIFVMLYLWTWKCERVLVYTQAKVHQCELIRLHSRPHPLIMWCCNVVDNMSVAVTKTTILEVLESTLEHEICMKAKYSVAYLILFCEIWKTAEFV